MKIIHTPGLPRSFAGHPAGGSIIAEHDIKFTRGSRLAAKLLVFTHSKAMTKFWAHAIGHRMSPGALEAVNALARETSPGVLECDPRYYCVIGLTKGALCMEVITHESVHAGFAFANRHRRNFWVESPKDYIEEDVCYPAGRVAKRINAFLHDRGLYS